MSARMVWGAFLFLNVLLNPHHQAKAYNPYENIDACAVQALVIEQEERIPHGLLSAITLVESGRNRNHVFHAWPWTVQSQGQSYYFSNKTAAVAAVRRLIHQGIRNIDVGCAQINLSHHPRAFRNLDEAFDPRTNIRYAAYFLKRLVKKKQSWHEAVAHYHSANAAYHVPYRHKVYKAWDREKRKHPHNPISSHKQSIKNVQSNRYFSRISPYRPISQYLSHVPPLVPPKLLWKTSLKHSCKPTPRFNRAIRPNGPKRIENPRIPQKRFP